MEKLRATKNSDMVKYITGQKIPGSWSCLQVERRDLKEAHPQVTLMKLYKSWDLAEDQIDAKFKALSTPFSLVQGPPGIGKSKTMAAHLWTLGILGRKPIACAASNTAVDQLVLKLAENNPFEFYQSTKDDAILRLHHSQSEYDVLLGLEMSDSDMLELMQLVAENDMQVESQGPSLQEDMVIDQVWRMKSHAAKIGDLKLPLCSLAAKCIRISARDQRVSEKDEKIADSSQFFMETHVKPKDKVRLSRTYKKLFAKEFRLLKPRALAATPIIVTTCNGAVNADIISTAFITEAVPDETGQANEITAIIPIGSLDPCRITIYEDYKHLALTGVSKKGNEFANQADYSPS
ncbi:DEAD-box type RNA helicase [Xylographa carneopallida]|nr:DEAD-box type RNA helicase [Xylographa carneopallida]